MTIKLGRNDACWCGSGLKYKQCHATSDEKMHHLATSGYTIPNQKLLKTKKDIEGIRASSKINIHILDEVQSLVKEGISTNEIDRWIHETTISLGGIPATLNYNGFTKSCCTSINHVVCHGIPADKMILKAGDIVNIDVSTIYNGYFSDSSRMFCVGDVSPEKKRLVDVTKACMDIGIEQIKPWGFLGDVGDAVNAHATQNGYTVVREIGGHGIGLQFHEEPWVSYVSKKGTGMILVPGLVFTVEPMINMGSAKIFTDEKDGWTVYTADGKPSAQWEKTVLVTESGFEVLTY